MSMVRIDGTLVVKKIKNSRNGPFCVADLITDVGEFKVKDPVLDQFAEGEYKGTFWVSEIYLAPYVSFGRAVTEMRARLHDLQLRNTTGKPLSSDDSDTEPDPMDEAPPTRVGRNKDAKGSKAPVKHPAIKVGRKGGAQTHGLDGEQSAQGDQSGGNAEGHAGAGTDLVDLFGEEIAGYIETQQSVKLDPTIDDRARFRSQTARLRELGYDFDAREQIWRQKA